MSIQFAIKFIFILSLFSPIAKSEVSKFSYNDYAALLKQYVVKMGDETKVRYADLKKDKQNLLRVNKMFSAVKKSEFNAWNKEGQIAFLINVYNSFTLQLIVENFPIKSIRKINFFSSPWKDKFFTLFGEKASLDFVEHEVLRKNYKEARIHFAVNCASIACPPLQGVPFLGSTLDEQLAQAAKTFLRSSKFNKYDEASNTLHLSSIFKWYGSDFGTEEELKTFIGIQLWDQPDGKNLKKLEKAKIKYLDYDWNLNGV